MNEKFVKAGEKMLVVKIEEQILEVEEKQALEAKVEDKQEEAE